MHLAEVNLTAINVMAPLMQQELYPNRSLVGREMVTDNLSSLDMVEVVWCYLCMHDGLVSQHNCAEGCQGRLVYRVSCTRSQLRRANARNPSFDGLSKGPLIEDVLH